MPAFDFLVQHLDARAGEALLDLGADLTWSTHQMATRGLDCTAVDINDHLSVGNVFGRHSGVPYYLIRTDMRRATFRAGTFDIVLAMNALHHNDSLQDVAAEIARVLKPGGRLAFSEPYCTTEEEKAAFGRTQIDAGISEQTYLLQEWHAAFVRVGLRVRAIRVADSFAAIYEKAVVSPTGLPGDTADLAGLFAHGYDGGLTLTNESRSVAPETVFQVPLTIENRSQAVWSSNSQYPIYASYHLYRRIDDHDELVTFDNRRTALPESVGLGERTAMLIDVAAPTRLGSYVAEIDLVQEGISWFVLKGMRTRSLTFRVVGSA